MLPMGFGKSLIYASMPFAFDILNASTESVVAVITPPTAIMKDQVILPTNDVVKFLSPLAGSACP